MTPSDKTRRSQPFSLATYNNMMLLKRQLEAHLKDPQAPVPDATLLTTAGRTPDETYTVVRVEGEDRIIIGVPAHQVPKGYHLPTYSLAATLVLKTLMLFGGHYTINKNGQGKPLPRLYGGNRRIMVARPLANAQKGEVIRGKTRVSVEYVRHVEGRPSKTPYKDRGRCVKTALWYYRANHKTSGIPISATGYSRLLASVFRLYDAIMAAKRPTVIDTVSPTPQAHAATL